jgi:hypothetical protein
MGGWSSGAGGAVALGTGLAGMMMARKHRKKMEDAAEKAVESLEKVGVPSVDAQKIVLQNPKMLFDFDPELQQIYDQTESELKQVEVDSRLKDAQMSALDQLQEAGETGIDDATRNELAAMRRGSAAQAQARDASIIQDLASRGMSGSGQELAMRQIANQQAMQGELEASDRMAAMAQQNALQAIASAGQLGGQIRGQEFGEESTKASAQDAINRFNAMNRQRITGSNIDARNQAELQKQQMKQRLEEGRADTANQQEMHNKGLLQTKFSNDLSLGKAKSQAYLGKAGMHGQQAANVATSMAQIGAGAGKAIATGDW